MLNLRAASIVLGVATLVACAGGMSTTAGNGTGFEPASASHSSTNSGARSIRSNLPTAVDLGVRAASAPVDVVLVLNYNDRAGLQRFVDGLATPGRHTYLTHDDFMARYAPTQAQLGTVVAHLRANGFTIARTYPNRLVVDARASSATVSRYFGTTIHSYRQGRYGERFASVRPVRMPSDLGGLLDAVVIDNVVRMQPTIEAVPQGAGLAPDVANVIGNPGFETGKLSPWTACSGSKKLPGGAIAHTDPHSGTYDAFAGNDSTSSPEIDGLTGICQNIDVPSKATLSYWVRPISDDTKVTATAQVVGFFDASTGKLIKTLTSSNTNSSKWLSEKTSLSEYAGEKLTLFFGVIGSSNEKKKYIGLYVDDVALEAAATPTPSPKPTATPTVKPTAKPTSSPTVRPTSTPTSAPSPYPTAGPTGNPITGPSTYGEGWGPGAMVAPFDYPLAAGYPGAGVTVGVVIGSPVQLSDIAEYTSYFGIPNDGGTVTNQPVDGGSTFSTSNDSSDEATLDVETIAGLAPGANIIVYAMPNLGENYIVDAYNAAASNSAVKVVNSSFGGCETEDPGPSGYDTATDDIALGAAAQGVTFSASSGDQGSDCYNGSYVFGVNAPASDPHFVGVGGTDSSYPNVASTQVWDDNSVYGSGYDAGGGGLSTVWTPPPYQLGISGASSAHRSVPDIALPAVGDAIYFNGGWEYVDGTSWASPLYVAMQAEIDQACGAQYGLAELYAAYKTTPGDFIDITSGNNEYNGSTGYNAVAGFDQASGMGSPLGTNIIAATCSAPALRHAVMPRR